MNQFENPIKRQPEGKIQPLPSSEKQGPDIEINEIEVGAGGEITVRNARRGETRVNKPSSTEIVNGNLARRFGIANDYLELLPEADRDIIMRNVQNSLKGVVPADYDRERQMAVVKEVSKKMSESRAARSAKSD